jgi:hypothetical protein
MGCGKICTQRKIYSEKYLLKKKKDISNQQPNFIPKRMKKAAEKLNPLSVEER